MAVLALHMAKNTKQPLKQRIHDLATSENSKNRKLANDIYHMALQAKLFSRSRILDSSEMAILIEQAIAYVNEVKHGNIKVYLAERLVVDAVMEYIRQVNVPGMHIDQYLASWQYSASSFGFIADDCLAEAFIHAHESRGLTE